MSNHEHRLRRAEAAAGPLDSTAGCADCRGHYYLPQIVWPGEGATPAEERRCQTCGRVLPDYPATAPLPRITWPGAP
jgi:hypothetical protein